MKALIVRLSAIGDVVHTLPALAALRRHGWQVEWLVEPAARPLLEGSPPVARVVAAPSARAFRLRAALRTRRELREARYEAALDMQGLWKSAAWARGSGGLRVIGYDRRWRREPASAVLLHERVDLPAEVSHVIDKNLWLLRALDVHAVGSREFPLPAAEAETVRVSALLDEMGLGAFVILNPGGGWASKLWPPERFGEVAAALAARGLSSLVTWGPGEQGLAERVVAAGAGRARLSPPTTLLEYLALARRARLVVAADTGPLHLAAAAGTAVVGLFGPTDPARNGPFSAEDQVVRRTPLCTPCHRHRCRLHEGAMEAIGVEEVLRAIDRRLANTSSAVTQPAPLLRATGA